MRATQALHIAQNGIDRVFSHIDPSVKPIPLTRRQRFIAKGVTLYREVVEYAENNEFLKGLL